MADESVEGEEPQFDRLRCVRSAQFRSIRVDGAWGGLKDGLIHMTLFSDTLDPPESFRVLVGGDGALTTETAAQVGPLREFEALLVMQPRVAVQIAVWLLDKAGISMPDEGTVSDGDMDDV